MLTPLIERTLEIKIYKSNGKNKKFTRRHD